MDTETFDVWYYWKKFTIPISYKDGYIATDSYGKVLVHKDIPRIGVMETFWINPSGMKYIGKHGVSGMYWKSSMVKISDLEVL